MYIGIFKLILKRRIFLKADSVARFINAIKPIRARNKAVITYGIIKTAVAVVLALYLSSITVKKFAATIMCLMFVINIIIKFIEGCLEYKNTHIFPLEDIKIISVAKDIKIYRAQLIATIIYSFFSDELFWGELVYLFGLCCKYDFTNLLVINFICIVALSFIIGNFIVGKYMYAVIVKKITLLRLIVYILNGTCIFSVFYFIGDYLIQILYVSLLKKIDSVGILLSDSKLENIFNGVGDKLVSDVTNVANILNNGTTYFASFIIFPLFILTMMVVYKIPVKLIPISESLSLDNEKDGLSLLVRVFCYLGRHKGLILKNEISSIADLRWIFSKNFFQMTVLNYENYVYASITALIISKSKDPILILQTLICFTILATVNQCNDLRYSAFAFFSASSRKQQMILLKMSLAKKDLIWKAKEDIFGFFQRFPFAIILLLDVIAAIYCGLYWAILIIAFVWIGCISIMPLIQTHMLPMVSNPNIVLKNQVGNDFIEDEMAAKMQEFPRIFIVVVPMLLTVTMCIVKRLRNMNVVIVELIYLSILILIFREILRGIRNKGVKIFCDKIY